MPKRVNVDDYFAQLAEHERPHLGALREVSVATDPTAREALKWNLPVYVCGRTPLACPELIEADGLRPGRFRMR